MGYYGELPSYCKGLEKSPVGGLKNVIKMMIFWTGNANTNVQFVCLSKSTICHQNRKSPQCF